MFEEQRSKRSVMTIDHEEYNVSYNEYSTGAYSREILGETQSIWWA